MLEFPDSSIFKLTLELPDAVAVQYALQSSTLANTDGGLEYALSNVTVPVPLYGNAVEPPAFVFTFTVPY